jgi:hypothetical protein
MDELDALREELEHYRTEKEKIRNIVGQVGGKTSRRVHTVINGLFLILVLAAFLFDVLRHVMQWSIPYLPTTLVLEVAVLLVSLKIIWMIYTQTKVDHFQFWVLSTIEFQMNVISRRVSDLSSSVKAIEKGLQRADADGDAPSSDTS